MKFIYSASLLFATFALAAQSPLNEQNISTHLAEFTKTPHPMGSLRQKELAEMYVKTFSNAGWKSRLQETIVTAPPPWGNTPLKNVIAHLKGSKSCSIIMGGHFDTKHFKDFTFVGANDGGSSTALILELSRVLPEHQKSGVSKKSYLHCDITIVLFDGEEAFLNDWHDGNKKFNIEDHLYGSRYFASTLKKKNKKYVYEGKPIENIIVMDMIGHKDQVLSISAKPKSNFFKSLKKCPEIKTKDEAQDITDDHTPFKEKGIPFFHAIDWTNLLEWHTSKDTMAIISSKKIAHFGNCLLQALKTEE